MTLEKVAINSVSTADGPLEEICAAYSAAGFRNVEFPLHRLKAGMKRDGLSVSDVQSLLKKHSLRCIGGFEAPLIAFDAGQMEANHALHVENARLLETLGGGGVLVVGTDGPEKKSIEALQTVGKTMAAVAERMPSSVSLAVEFNWSPLVKSLKSAFVVAEAANHPRVGILFDPAHYHCTASHLEELNEAVVHKVLHVHMNDMRDKPGDLSECNGDRVPPGQGILDLRSILARFRQFGYQGFYSIELFNAEIWKMPVGEASRICFESMKGLCRN
jgi:2-keto-myo-inositol isomerase